MEVRYLRRDMGGRATFPYTGAATEVSRYGADLLGDDSGSMWVVSTLYPLSTSPLLDFISLQTQIF